MIDLSQLHEIGHKSSEDVLEYSGTWRLHKENELLRIELDGITSGEDESVHIPSHGWTWHTHPKDCPNINDCSIIPPSANDLGIFALRSSDQHLVISRKRVYWIKAARKYSDTEAENIERFFKIIEKYFDTSTVSHETFDTVFELACRMSNFFKIYKFPNQKLVSTNYS